jgi:FkbM family methyltransferase
MSLFTTKRRFEFGTITKPQYISEMHAQHVKLFEYADWLGTTDIARIEITSGQVIMVSRSSNIRIHCDRHNKRIAPIEILNFGDYEKKDADMILRLIKPRFTVIDIGANIGWYTLNIAKMCGAARVLAIEPVPATFEALQANIALNQLDTITAYNIGFSDHTGVERFFFSPDGFDNASMVNLSERADAQAVPCEVMTLDEFAVARKLHVDFIKCDVEGAELSVFKGAVATLRQDHPIVFTEMLRKWSAKFNYHPNAIIDLFSDLGYRCFTAKAGRLAEFLKMDESTMETNFFFLHSTHHATEISQCL